MPCGPFSSLSVSLDPLLGPVDASPPRSMETPPVRRPAQNSRLRVRRAIQAVRLRSNIKTRRTAKSFREFESSFRGRAAAPRTSRCRPGFKGRLEPQRNRDPEVGADQPDVQQRIREAIRPGVQSQILEEPGGESTRRWNVPRSENRPRGTSHNAHSIRFGRWVVSFGAVGPMPLERFTFGWHTTGRRKEEKRTLLADHHRILS